MCGIQGGGHISGSSAQPDATNYVLAPWELNVTRTTQKLKRLDVARFRRPVHEAVPLVIPSFDRGSQVLRL